MVITNEQNTKLSKYALLCLLVEKAVNSIGAVHNANKVTLKTTIFNTIVKKARGEK